MAQFEEEPLHRTDRSEARFNEAVPHDQKYTASPQQHGIAHALPQQPQDVGFHVDKPISVSDTGYGGISGRGNDITAVVEEAREQPPKLHPDGRGSFTERAKDMTHGVKDTLTGKKQNEASKPVVDQSGAHESEGEGFGERVKEFVTGQKPGHGVATEDGSGDLPLNERGNPNPPSLLDPVERGPNEEPSSATYTDRHGRPIEGPREDNTKKEGVMSKVMDKFNLGANKD